MMSKCIYSVGRRFVNEVLLNGKLEFLETKLVNREVIN